MKAQRKVRFIPLLLCLFCTWLTGPALADGAVGALSLEQSPTYRSAKIYLCPQVDQPLAFLGYTRLYAEEGLLVLKPEPEDAAILPGADRTLYLVPRVPKEGGKAALSDWNVFIADWSRAEALAGEAVAERADQGYAGAKIGAAGVLLGNSGLSPNDYTDLMRRGMDFLAAEEEGVWYPLASVALHAGYVVGGVPEAKLSAPFAALPASALTPLIKRVKNIAYRNDHRIVVTQNGDYLVVAVTEGGELLYSMAHVTNVQ